jgi:hypothetical protein
VYKIKLICENNLPGSCWQIKCKDWVACTQSISYHLLFPFTLRTAHLSFKLEFVGKFVSQFE